MFVAPQFTIVERDLQIGQMRTCGINLRCFHVVDFAYSALASKGILCHRLNVAAMKIQGVAPFFPRFLLGATLIFWGFTADLPIIGLILAVVVEGRNWLTIRWNFGDKAYVRAWSMSVLAMLATALLLWMDGLQPETVRKFTSWMPLFLVSVQFTQSYGMEGKLPLHTFSYFSRKKFLRDQKMGLANLPQTIPFTPVYFVLCLLFSATGVNSYASWFFPGLLLLSVWCLWGLCRNHERRKAVLGISLALMMALAVCTQWCLRNSVEFFMGQRMEEYGAAEDGVRWQRSSSRIGQVGQIKQSSQIFWRLKTMQGPVPALVRIACYNRYFSSGHWRYDPPLDTAQEQDFNGLYVIGLADRTMKPTVNEFLYRSVGEVPAGQEARDDLPRYSMRGGVKAASLLPLPGALHTMHLSAQDLEKNSVGSIRITPRHAVLDATVRWDGEFDSDGPVFADEGGDMSVDLAVPVQEREVLREIVASLSLSTLNFEEKIAALRRYFSRNFSYSTYLTINSKLNSKWNAERNNGKSRAITGRDSALAQFLLEEKAGHCEYFATATTLLLRSAGLKARYCVGFAVQEKNTKNDEFVIRGTHGHAWCRAWNDSSQRWVDVDLTPPTGFRVDQPVIGWQRSAADFLQLLREDFTVWRTQPKNQRTVMLSLSILGLALLVWIGRSLWKTHSRVTRTMHRHAPPRLETPLSKLDRWLVKKIGLRPPGMPYGHWVGRLHVSVDSQLLAEAVAIHNRLRYDPTPAEPLLLERLQLLCRNLKTLLR